MFDKLAAVEARYEALGELLAQPDVVTNPALLQRYGQEQSDLEALVDAYRKYRAAQASVASYEQTLSEPGLEAEYVELAKDELETGRLKLVQLIEELKMLLLPRDPNDEKNVIVEIRAGAGGDEAGLFAADLFRMYSRYAERHRWSSEIMSANEGGVGSFREVIFRLNGRNAYSRLKFESGVHRVQRIPSTEASGRIHTSTATVAVLPEAEEVDVQIAPEDLRVDVYRSTGHGGQSVNTTDSAVRITHLPTGLVVTCQDEKSQLKNKNKAMTVLRSRLLSQETQRRQQEQDATRRSQVGSGDRSEKIRTYNFPQDRVTDHRINVTLHRLPDVLDGNLEPLIDALNASDQAERLQAEVLPEAGVLAAAS
ncbi:MAG: peptide chain release factor 1 [Chloroflexota bacterium]